MTTEERNQAIDALGITFTVTTLDTGKADIPGKQKGAPSSHICQLTRRNVTIETPYSMGCGCREYIAGWKEILLATNETTRQPNWKPVPQIWGKPTALQLKALESSRARPQLADVLYSLVSDSQCANDTFADFCADLGYDTDSRKALETYLACQESGTKLRKLGLNLAQLSELFQDY